MPPSRWRITRAGGGRRRPGRRQGQGCGGQLLVAKALDDQAWALLNLGKLEQAAIAARQSKEIYDAAGDQFGASRALGDGGTVLLTQGDVTGAMAYQESLQITRRIGNKHGDAAWLNQLANCYYRQGRSRRGKEVIARTDDSNLAGDR